MFLGLHLFGSFIWATRPAVRTLHARAVDGLLNASSQHQAAFSTGTLLSRFAQDDQQGVSNQIVQALQNGASTSAALGLKVQSLVEAARQSREAL